MPLYVSVGHLTLDELVVEGKLVSVKLGGAVAYGAVTARALGWRAAVISKIGEDMPPEHISYLASTGVDVSGVRRSPGQTTRFRLETEEGTTRHLRPAVAPPILPNDLSGALVRAEVVHLGPVAGELGVDVIREITGRTRGLVALDLQGLVRAFGVGGEVVLSEGEVAREATALSEVIHANDAEAAATTGERDPALAAQHLLALGPKLACVTLGPNGSVVASEEGVFIIRAGRSRRVVDELGAGDIYLAALAIARREGMGVRQSSAVASAAASSSVELSGPSPLPSREVMEGRAGSLIGSIRAWRSPQL